MKELRNQFEQFHTVSPMHRLLLLTGIVFLRARSRNPETHKYGGEHVKHHGLLNAIFGTNKKNRVCVCVCVAIEFQ